jgi:hypothetical protein
MHLFLWTLRFTIAAFFAGWWNSSNTIIIQSYRSVSLPSRYAISRILLPVESEQFHVAWVLINITAGPLDQVQAVVDAQAVPQLVRLLRDSTEEATRELSIWVLGNIAAETLQHRDYVIREGTIPPLVEFLSLDHENSVTRTAVRGLRYLCREAATFTSWHIEQVSSV